MARNASVAIGACLNRVVRSFASAQAIFTILYAMYRMYVPSATNSHTDNTVFGFSLVFNIMAVALAFAAILVPRTGPALIEMLLATLGIAAVFEIYNLTNIMDTRHAVATVLVSVTYILFYAAYAAILLYLRFRFSAADWDAYDDVVDDGKIDAWGYHAAELQSAGLQKAAPAFFMLTNLAVIETTVVFASILFATSLSIRDEGGYVFFLHVATSAIAYVHISSKPDARLENHTQYWLITLACIEFVLDITQLAASGWFGVDGDNALYIGMRIVLLSCALGYIAVMIVTGVEITAVAYAPAAFMLIVYGIATLVIIELCLAALYFTYAFAPPRSGKDVHWELLLHVIPVMAGVAACCIEEDVAAFQNALKALAAFSLVGTGYELIMVWQLHDLFVHIPLLLTVFLLGLLAIVLLSGLGLRSTGSEEKDIRGYFAIVVGEKTTAAHAADFFFPKGELPEGQSIELFKKGAEKLYFFASMVLRRVFLFEASFLYFLLVIMARQVQAPGAANPAWYQWLYLLHALPLIASLMTWTFQFDMEMTTTFLAFSAAFCLITDAVLFAFLVTSVAWSVAALLSLFFLADLANLLTCAIMLFRCHPGAFVMVKFMNGVTNRLQIHSTLDG